MGSPRVLLDPPAAAVIGGGFIGPVHAEAMRRIGVPILGLLGSSPERVRPVAERLGIPRIYRDLDELLDDPAAAVVHVASPNAAHHQQVMRCLHAGRHVVCEKPLAVSSDQTAELTALAGERPAQAAAVNYNVRFYPLCHEMRARVLRGDLGRIFSVHGSYTQDWLLDPRDYNWRVEADGTSHLRAVADIGTHWMDLAQFIVGRPIVGVMADLATIHGERLRAVGSSPTFRGASDTETFETVPVTTEDQAWVLLHFADGIRGGLHVSQVTAGRKNRLELEVAGTEGSMAWDSEAPNQLRLGRRGGPNLVLERDPSLLAPEAAALAHYPGGHAEGFPDTFAQLFLAVYDWIAARGRTPPAFPTFADGDHEVRLCEAIARSAREGRWITL